MLPAGLLSAGLDSAGLDAVQLHFTVHWAVRSPLETVITAEPGATAVTVPLPLTVATFSSLEEKVTLPPSGERVYFRR